MSITATAVEGTQRERPILFSADMVRAILAGQKTQTRRVITPQPRVFENGAWEWPNRARTASRAGCGSVRHLYRDLPAYCPYGEPGDRLWVRETWAPIGDVADPGTQALSDGCFYRADYPEPPDAIHDQVRWKPSIHMPRAFSRIILEVTDVRVERVQDCPEEDAIAEGVRFDGTYWQGAPHAVKGTPTVYPTARQAFESRWNALNAHRGFGWDANPWVWVVTFRRVSA